MQNITGHITKKSQLYESPPPSGTLNQLKSEDQKTAQDFGFKLVQSLYDWHPVASPSYKLLIMIFDSEVSCSCN